MTIEEAKAKLEKFGQMQVLKYYDELDEAQKEALLAQIDSTDMSIQANCKNKEELEKRGEITPLDCMELTEIAANKDEYEKKGMHCVGINPAANLVEIVEIPDKRWYIGTQFHPEYSSTVLHPHPLFMSFIKSCIQ